MSKEHDQDYEALVEDYEDALMRLIMYRVAQEDGKRLLEEAEELERSGFEVPKELDEKCLKLIRDLPAAPVHKQNQEQNDPKESTSRRYFRLRIVGRVLVAAILAAVLLFSVAYASNDNFRVDVLNFFLEIEENGTFFFFRSAPAGGISLNSQYDSSEAEDFAFEFTYIPDGFELVLKEKSDWGTFGNIFHCGYADPRYDYHEFSFKIAPVVDGSGLFVDTEDAIITDVTILGYDGWQIQKNDPYTGENNIMFFLLDLENQKRFHYNSLGISLEESQKIMDGIVIYGE